MIVSVDPRPGWIETPYPESDQFFRILRFFVIESPVESLSARQKDLAYYGWITPWRKPYYLRKQLNNLSGNSNLIFSANDYSALGNEFAKANLLSFPPSDFTERVCFYNGKYGAQYLNLFFHIRNSFAHGRFSIRENDIILMEDATKGKKNEVPSGMLKCSARMVLSMNTLSKWIYYIEGGEKNWYEVSQTSSIS